MLHRATNLLTACWDYVCCRAGRLRWRHLPCFVSVEPANYCQLRCPECPVGQATERGDGRKERRVMSMELFEKVLAETGDRIHTMQFFFQGEPLLNKDLPKMVRAAHERGIYTIVSTNAQLLSSEVADALLDAGLSRVIVSIDGLSEESYQAYRKGGSLEKALAGLRCLRAGKERLHARTCIELQCLRLKSNEHEWGEMKRRYKELGADVLTLKTAQLYDYEDGNELMPSEDKYSRYVRGKDGKYKLRKQGRGICWRIVSGCVIDADGNVLPCCFDKGGKYVFGNLRERSFAGCWHSAAAQRFRERVMRDRRGVEICGNCIE